MDHPNDQQLHHFNKDQQQGLSISIVTNNSTNSKSNDDDNVVRMNQVTNATTNETKQVTSSTASTTSISSSFIFDPNRFRNLVHQRQSLTYKSPTNNNSTSRLTRPTSTSSSTNPKDDLPSLLDIDLQTSPPSSSSSVSYSPPSSSSLYILSKYKHQHQNEESNQSIHHNHHPKIQNKHKTTLATKLSKSTLSSSLTEMSKRIQREKQRQEQIDEKEIFNLHSYFDYNQNINKPQHHHHLTNSSHSSSLLQKFQNKNGYNNVHTLQALSKLSQKYNHIEHNQYSIKSDTNNSKNEIIKDRNNSIHSFYHSINDELDDDDDDNNDYDYDDGIHSLGYISLSSNCSCNNDYDGKNVVGRTTSTTLHTKSTVRSSSSSSCNSILCKKNYLQQLGWMQQQIIISENDNNDDSDCNENHDHNHSQEKRALQKNLIKDDSSTITSLLSDSEILAVASSSTTTTTTRTRTVLQCLVIIAIAISWMILVILMIVIVYYHPRITSSNDNIQKNNNNEQQYYVSLYHSIQYEYYTLLQRGKGSMIHVMTKWILGSSSWYYFNELLNIIEYGLECIISQSHFGVGNNSSLGIGKDHYGRNQSNYFTRDDVGAIIHNWTPVTSSSSLASSGDIWELGEYYWSSHGVPSNYTVLVLNNEEECSENDTNESKNIESIKHNVCPLLLLNGMKFKDWGFHPISYNIRMLSSMYIIQSDEVCTSQLRRLIRKIRLIEPSKKVGYCHMPESETTKLYMREEPTRRLEENISLSTEISHEVYHSDLREENPLEEYQAIPFEKSFQVNDADLSQPTSNAMVSDTTCPSISQYLKIKDVAFKSFKTILVEEGVIIVEVKKMHPHQKRRIRKKLRNLNVKVIIHEDESYISSADNDQLESRDSFGWRNSQFWTSTSPFVAKGRNESKSRLHITTDVVKWETIQKKSTPCFLSDLDPRHRFPGKPSHLYCKYPYPTLDELEHSAISFMNEEAGDFQDFHLLDTVVDFFNIWRKERQVRRKLKAQRNNLQLN